MTTSVYSCPVPNSNSNIHSSINVITKEEYQRLLNIIDKQKCIIKSLLKNATPEQLIEYIETLLD
jgi:hypothetical protein